VRACQLLLDLVLGSGKGQATGPEKMVQVHGRVQGGQWAQEGTLLRASVQRGVGQAQRRGESSIGWHGQ
jgi:hypothetical protein